MKIITWNVNGLRAVLRNGGQHWLAEQQADLICLQEIKATPGQIDFSQLGALQAYHASWHPAERPGYSGVVTFSREKPMKASLTLGVEEFDREGRLVWTQIAGFHLFNVYFPNGKRDHGRLTYKLNFYAHLLVVLEELLHAGERVIVCGDFNTAHREIDLRNPKQNQNTSGFLPEERAWIDRYLQAGFVDIFRVYYPERVQYTWWTYRVNARARDIGWRLDYFLISENCQPYVQAVEIHDQVPGSDHCPVSLVVSQSGDQSIR